MVKQADYKGYNLVQMRSGKVNVYDPRWHADPAYIADSFDDAKRWVRAYRDGAQWAVDAALGMEV